MVVRQLQSAAASRCPADVTLSIRCGGILTIGVLAWPTLLQAEAHKLEGEANEKLSEAQAAAQVGTTFDKTKLSLWPGAFAWLH